MKLAERIKQMSEPEAREESKRLAKELTKKILVNATVAVAVHFLASAIINKLDPSDDQLAIED